MTDHTAKTADEDRYGFRWGPMVVQRAAEFPRGDVDKPTRCLRVITDTGAEVEVYVSPTGRSLRVYRDGKELT